MISSIATTPTREPGVIFDRPSPTGIAGLDEILHGGLPENRLYLLLGSPGVGKTTMALQYLLEGARRGETGLYIALSETRDEILSVAHSHGWPIDKISIFELSALEQQLAQEERNTVFHPAEIELNKTTQMLLQRIEEVKPQRLVLDSLSELRLLSDTPLRYRRQMLSFKQYFSGKRMTVLLLDDHSAADGGDLHVQSIAHGVITLEEIVSDYGTSKRRLKINKLRGLNFIGGYHDAVIVPGGIKVFPRLPQASVSDSRDRGAVQSGIEQLDQLVGGGLDRGTSCLLLGPAGAGKSTLALQFAHAATKRGEKTLVCLFEENFETLKTRSASVGMPVDELIDAKQLSFVEIDPAHLSPGEFARLVIDHCQQNNTRIVIIDSLNGYLQAMPTDKFLSIQLRGLLSYLNRHGVLSILTVAQHGLVGHMQSPVDLTYLADTVILLRYFEQGGRIKKALSVIKKRIGRHEDTIREFKIDSGGIRVGAPLEAFHGVLTGVPTFTGSSEQMLKARKA